MFPWKHTYLELKYKYAGGVAAAVLDIDIRISECSLFYFNLIIHTPEASGFPRAQDLWELDQNSRSLWTNKPLM